MVLKYASMVVAAAVLLLAASAPSHACRCLPIARDATLAEMTIAFEGQILDVDTRGSVQVARLRVVHAIKGTQEGAVVTVQARGRTASCGYDFTGRTGMLVVGGGPDRAGAIQVNLCAMYNLNR
jgi:hypothetical protein